MKRVEQSFRTGELTRKVVVRPTADGGEPAFDGVPGPAFSASHDAAGRTILRLADGSAVRGAVVKDGAKVWVSYEGRTWCFEATAGAAKSRAMKDGVGEIRAPMTGKIVEVLVAAGTVVAAGAHLLTLEAMKMEHRLTAPGRARVAAISANLGAQVADGDVLVVLEAAPAETAS